MRWADLGLRHVPLQSIINEHLGSVLGGEFLVSGAKIALDLGLTIFPMEGMLAMSLSDTRGVSSKEGTAHQVV